MYGGRLRRPSHIPDDVFLAELEFYQLEPSVIDDYRKSEGYTEDDCQLPTNQTLRRLWLLFEHPETSRAAYWIAVISVIFTLMSIVLFCIAVISVIFTLMSIVLFSITVISVIFTLMSIVLFCIETLPYFALSHCENDDAPNFLDPFFVIETCCTLWFTIELLVRFVSSPSKLLFWRDFKNIVDLTAVVPYYVTFFNVVSTMSCASAKSSASLAFLRVIRLVRVFKLTKHSIGLQVLILTVKASSEELSLFLVVLLVCMLVYSSAIYYAELGVQGSQIHSIPDAFWWAIITMTTVGYGDQVPVGYPGKLIGAACAITGVLTLAMPVPIITGHFNRFYSHKIGRSKRF
jgi:Ion transport protein